MFTVSPAKIATVTVRHQRKQRESPDQTAGARRDPADLARRAAISLPTCPNTSAATNQHIDKVGQQNQTQCRREAEPRSNGPMTR